MPRLPCSNSSNPEPFEPPCSNSSNDESFEPPCSNSSNDESFEPPCQAFRPALTGVVAVRSRQGPGCNTSESFKVPEGLEGFDWPAFPISYKTTSAKSNVARTWPQTPDARAGPHGRLTQKPVRRALGATPITAKGAPCRPRANL